MTRIRILISSQIWIWFLLRFGFRHWRMTFEEWRRRILFIVRINSSVELHSTKPCSSLFKALLKAASVVALAVSYSERSRCKQCFCTSGLSSREERWDLRGRETGWNLRILLDLASGSPVALLEVKAFKCFFAWKAWFLLGIGGRMWISKHGEFWLEFGILFSYGKLIKCIKVYIIIIIGQLCFFHTDWWPGLISSVTNIF